MFEAKRKSWVIFCFVVVWPASRTWTGWIALLFFYISFYGQRTAVHETERTSSSRQLSHTRTECLGAPPFSRCSPLMFVQ